MLDAIPFFDTHCHLDFPELSIEIEHFTAQALASGVSHLLIPGVSESRWQIQRDLQAYLSKQIPQCTTYLALGVHPWWQQEFTSDTCFALEQQLKCIDAAPVAVGECGLDFALDWLSEAERSQHKLQQTAVLRMQVELARTYQKPLILHHRKSQTEVLALLKQCRFAEGGILHAFSGSQAQAHAFLDMGFKLGIGGTISFERAQKTRHTVQKLPVEAFVLETDAPAMPLAGFQGQHNHPAMLRHVFYCLCQLRHEAPEDLALQLWRNSMVALQLQ